LPGAEKAMEVRLERNRNVAFLDPTYTAKMGILAQKNGMRNATVKVGLWVWLWQEWLRSGLLLFCW